MMSQNDKEDEEIRLRDKIAIAAMQALIDRFTAKIGDAWIKSSEPTKDYEEDVMIIARMAYQMADAMRKARIQTFD